MRWGGHGGQIPHNHTYDDSSFPDNSIDEAYNYCRNPNNSRTWPWCYTTDPQVEWEFCPIINCRGDILAFVMRVLCCLTKGQTFCYL